MKCVKEEIVNTIIIDKSEFINILIPVDNKESVKDIIDNIKTRWKDATHYCYAYIIGDYQKSSDDNEPGGTAGIPMLEVLIANNFVDTLCVTVRYFGGIKLGAGGLSRAYRKSVTENIKENNDKIKDVTLGYLVELITDYDKQKEIEYTFKRIENKKFEDKISYIIKVTKEEYESLKDKYDLKIIDNTKVEI